MDNKNIAVGHHANNDEIMSTECIVVGTWSQSRNYRRCIIIGAGLFAQHDYHLLISDGQSVSIDYTMTETEWRNIFNSFNVLLKNFSEKHFQDHLKRYASKLNKDKPNKDKPNKDKPNKDKPNKDKESNDSA